MELAATIWLWIQIVGIAIGTLLWIVVAIWAFKVIRDNS